MTIRLRLYALMVLGALVSAGVSPSEAADSPQQLKAACENGTPRACLFLAVIYAKGMEGTKQDDAQAAVFFKKACDGGVALGVRQCQRIFGHMGFRLRKPRPQVAQSDPVKVAAFKKTASPGTTPRR